MRLISGVDSLVVGALDAIIIIVIVYCFNDAAQLAAWENPLIDWRLQSSTMILYCGYVCN